MNKQVIEYVEVHIGLLGTTTRTLRNPVLCKDKYCSSWGRPRVRVAGTMFYGQSMPTLQASFIMNDVNSFEFSNHSRSYFA